MQFLALASVVSTPTPILATPPPIQTEFGNFDVSNPHVLAQFVSQFYGIGLGMIGGVALLFIMWGGYTILMSQGRSAEVAKGKSFIVYAIAGLLLAVFGFVIMQFITGALGVPTT